MSVIQMESFVRDLRRKRGRGPEYNCPKYKVPNPGRFSDSGVENIFENFATSWSSTVEGTRGEVKCQRSYM